MLQHDHVLGLRGPRSLTHAAAPTPYGRPQKALSAGDEKADVVLGVDYLRMHANTSWMLERRPLLERLQVERLCRGEDLRVSATVAWHWLHSCCYSHYYTIIIIIIITIIIISSSIVIVIIHHHIIT